MPFSVRRLQEMKKAQKSFKRSTIRRLIVLASLILLFVTLYLLTLNQSVCEFFATTISRAWITAFGTLLGWIPFSLYEMLLIVAILGGIAFVVIEIVLMCKRKWKKCLTALLIVAICVLSFLNVYTVSASFAYNRDPLPTSVYEEYSSDDLTVEEALSIAEYVIDQANLAYKNTEHDEEGNIVYPYTLREMSELLDKEYGKLDGNYFSSYTPCGKRVLNKTIMSELGITGVFFAPFGEANVNINSKLYLPTTLGHEMAHGKGVMREYEADLVGQYVCLTSEDPYIRYGTLVQCVYYAINIVSQYPNTQKTVDQLYKSIDVGIINERNNYGAFWSQFDALDRIGEFFNDLYLKFQKQEGGTDSYTKPGIVEETGDKDDDDNPIVHVVRFSDTQNLLIKLYKQNKLV